MDCQTLITFTKMAEPRRETALQEASKATARLTLHDEARHAAFAEALAHALAWRERAFGGKGRGCPVRSLRELASNLPALLA